MTIIENLDDLITSIKGIKKDEPFTLAIQCNSPDPYKPPSGAGWRKAISMETAITNATKEVLIKIGHGTSNRYFHK